MACSRRRPWRWKLPALNPAATLSLSLASPLTVVLLTVCSLITGLLANDDPCTGLCDCKWKSGKISAICVDAKLTEIPKGLEAETQVLNLTGNNLGNIGQDAFEVARLLNLQKLFLARCRIKSLDRFAFRNLINLVELDLAYNSLLHVPSHVFGSISGLRELRLSGNLIQRILNDAFLQVPTLVRLELSECKLGTVELRAFYGLENTLEWLKLDKNKLISIPSSTLTVMQNLHSLELAENPWNCTCSLRQLREWILEQNIPSEVPPACSHPPRLRGKPWDKLELDEFACVPRISAPETHTTGVEGRNVTISCQIGGEPVPRVKWMLRNRVIANFSSTSTTTAQHRKLYVVQMDNDASNLTILAADLQDAGEYVCAAENKAGRAEARVTLDVLRRPPENVLSGRILIASIVVAALFVLASCLIVLCVCSLRRRQQGGGGGAGGVGGAARGGGRRRDDSYEKIEMNHKGPTMMNHAVGVVAGVRTVKGIGNNNSALSGTQNPSNSAAAATAAEVAVVGGSMSMMLKKQQHHRRRSRQRQQHGDYRGVPSVDTDLGEDEEEDDEDEEGGYEDEVETPTPTTVVSHSKASWSGDSSEVRGSVLSDPASDLHIPARDERMLSSDEMPSSRTSADFSANAAHNRTSKAAAALLRRELGDLGSTAHLAQHVMRKQIVGPNGGALYTSEPLEDSDKNYPDLLETSSYTTGNAVPIGGGGVGGAIIANGGGSSGGVGGDMVADSSFCTLPRRRGGTTGGGGRGGNRYYRGSDSQSPLLPDSRYGSSGGEGSGGSNGSIPRRSSIDSYSSSYYPLSSTLSGLGRKQHPPSISQQRSSSSMNLATSPGVSSVENSAVMGQGGNVLSGRPTSCRKNPSLPTSPVMERSSNLATPLLNLIGSRTGDYVKESIFHPTPSPSPSPSVVPSTAANTYDYHAAQLERFLEEYRSLQEQLCKMKETCENIRGTETVPSGRTLVGQPPIPAPSISRYLDPLPATTPTSSDDSAGGNPKSILKNKGAMPLPTTVVAVTASSASSSLGSGAAEVISPIGLGTSGGAVDYGSDLPPYWLPRNSVLRRFSGSDFYQS